MPNLDQRVREPPQRTVLVERVAFELTAIGHVVADGDPAMANRAETPEVWLMAGDCRSARV